MKLIKKHFNDWLRAKQLAETTINMYDCHFKRFKFFDFNQETVNQYCSQHNDYVGRAFLLNLRAYLINNNKYLGISPEKLLEIRAVELPKIAGRKKFKMPRIVTLEEVDRIVKFMEKERDRLMVQLIFFTGLRLGEFINLRAGDFNWETWKQDRSKLGILKVPFRGKTGEGIALVPADIMARLETWINSDYFDWKCSKFNDKDLEMPLFYPPTIRSWQKIFEKYSYRALGVRKNIHALRHGFATHLLDKGIDIRIIKEFLRHKSISSTEIYTHVKKELLEEKYKSVFG